MFSVDRVTESDYWCRFWLKLPVHENRDHYFHGVDLARPFVCGEEWNSVVSGWYLSCVGPNDNPLVRLSYFTSSIDSPAEIIGSGLPQGLVELGAKRERYEPGHKVVTGYALDLKEELRFRRYLCTYSWIGLDLMQAGDSHVAVVRETIGVAHHRRPRDTWQKQLEPMLQENSPSYRSLSPEGRSQFWADLQFSETRTDWAHMVMNMLGSK